MKNFFRITIPYKFEWNDLFGPATALNTFLVIKFGLIASWFGLAVALGCIIDDFVNVHRINLLILHSSIFVLNAYFLLVFYQIIT